MKNVKGIILAGGNATRLRPITSVITKQLLPIYDKPMIYYPLSILMLAKIKDIAIICAPEFKNSFKNLLGDGSQWGIKIKYLIQEKPEGIGQAYIIAEQFLQKQKSLMILGDNFLYGEGLTKILANTIKSKKPTIFGYEVNDPSRYGVLTLYKNKVTKIIEKPKIPDSNYAVTGLYFLDEKVAEYAKKIKKSKRGELEIVDILKIYLKKNILNTQLFGRGFNWFDTGTVDSLLDASNFVKSIQHRQGNIVGSPEEVSFRNKWIDDKSKLFDLNHKNSEYYKYIHEKLKN